MNANMSGVFSTLTLSGCQLHLIIVCLWNGGTFFMQKVTWMCDRPENKFQSLHQRLILTACQSCMNSEMAAVNLGLNKYLNVSKIITHNNRLFQINRRKINVSIYHRVFTCAGPAAGFLMSAYHCFYSWKVGVFPPCRAPPPVSVALIDATLPWRRLACPPIGRDILRPDREGVAARPRRLITDSST